MPCKFLQLGNLSLTSAPPCLSAKKPRSLPLDQSLLIYRAWRILQNGMLLALSSSCLAYRRSNFQFDTGGWFQVKLSSCQRLVSYASALLYLIQKPFQHAVNPPIHHAGSVPSYRRMHAFVLDGMTGSGFGFFNIRLYSSIEGQ